jgi:hypothetical protein
MSSSQRRKQAFSFEYTRNIGQTIQGGSKLPHSMAPFGRIFKNAALGETPASQWTAFVGRAHLRFICFPPEGELLWLALNITQTFKELL